MKQAYIRVFCILFLLATNRIFALESDSLTRIMPRGLEGIIVETYAVHPDNNSPGTTEDVLLKGYMTYRIFVDLAPGYKLQVLYGAPDHPLSIETTTRFYNNQDFGATSGSEIDETFLNSHNVAFDSWLGLGAATSSHLGVLKEDDYDGSILQYPSLKEKDGLIAGFAQVIHFYNLVPSFFQQEDSSEFTVNNGAWAVYEGVSGPTTNNCVLIAQLTTDGSISLSLNIQLLSPERIIERYVAENLKDNEILFKGLKINQFKSKNYGTKSFAQDPKE